MKAQVSSPSSPSFPSLATLQCNINGSAFPGVLREPLLHAEGQVAVLTATRGCFRYVAWVSAARSARSHEALCLSSHQ